VGIRSFLSPIVVHFSLVLLLCLIASAPIASNAALAVAVLGTGLVGLSYSGKIWLDMRKHGISAMIDLTDRLLYALLPPVGYLLVIIGGLTIGYHAIGGLSILAFACVMLLLVAIRNAWDMTIWIIDRSSPGIICDAAFSGALPAENRLPYTRHPRMLEVSAQAGGLTMRGITRFTLSATCAALTITALITFGSTSARTQTMGEYGTVTAHAAGAGASSSTMRPPEVHINPVSGSGPSKSIEVNDQEREDDSAAGARDKDDADAKGGDEWSQVSENE